MTSFPTPDKVDRLPPEPKTCPECGKRGRSLNAVLRGTWQCSLLECPLRKSPTAQPKDK